MDPMGYEMLMVCRTFRFFEAYQNNTTIFWGFRVLGGQPPGYPHQVRQELLRRGLFETDPMASEFGDELGCS